MTKSEMLRIAGLGLGLAMNLYHPDRALAAGNHCLEGVSCGAGVCQRTWFQPGSTAESYYCQCGGSPSWQCVNG